MIIVFAKHRRLTQNVLDMVRRYLSFGEKLNKRDYEAIIFALHFDGRTPIIERGFWNYNWEKLEQKCIVLKESNEDGSI